MVRFAIKTNNQEKEIFKIKEINNSSNKRYKDLIITF